MQGQHLHRVIDHGFAHVHQVMRGPGISVGRTVERGFFGQELGDVEQVGSVAQGFVQRDTAVDAEEGLVGMVGEGG